MPFIVEDGTGVADANSLCAVAFADSYFLDRGIVAWAGVTAAKETALVRATDYIETRFGLKFRGDVVDVNQALSWPRTDAGADDIVPLGVRKAASEYALRALTTTLAPDPTTDESGRVVASKSEKVGPISETTTFVGSSVVTFKPYPAADLLIKPWLRSNGGGLIRN